MDRNVTVPARAPNTPIATNFGDIMTSFDDSDVEVIGSNTASSIDLDFIQGFANANITTTVDVVPAEDIQMTSGELEGEETAFDDTTGLAPVISGDGDVVA